MSGTTETQRTPVMGPDQSERLPAQMAYEEARYKHTAPLLAAKREEADVAARSYWEQTMTAGRGASTSSPTAIAERATERAAQRVEDRRETKADARADEADGQRQARGMRV